MHGASQLPIIGWTKYFKKMEDQSNSNPKLQQTNKPPEYTFYKKNGILHFGKVNDAPDDNDAIDNAENENKFRCSICSKYYISRDSLRSHKRNRHGALSKGDYKKIKEHQCILCGKPFFTIEKVNKHVLVVHKEHKCDLCGKKFSSKGNMKQHDCSYKCDICGKSFSQEKYLKKHINTVHEDHNCNICGKLFKAGKRSMACFKSHINIVHGGKNNRKIKCDICEDLFEKTIDMKDHMISIHPINLKELKKDMIQLMVPLPNLQSNFLGNEITTDIKFELKDEIKLINYLEISHDQKCEKSFLSAQTLKKHIHEIHRSHTEPQSEKKIIKCHLCSKIFVRSSLKNQKSALKNHIMVEHPINFLSSKNSDFEKTL